MRGSLEGGWRCRSQRLSREGPADAIEAGLCDAACFWRDVQVVGSVGQAPALVRECGTQSRRREASSDRSNSTETRVPASDASRRRETSREPGEPVRVKAEATVFRAGDRELSLCRQLRLTLTTCSVAASTSTTVPPPEQRPE
jgi:hypothetical protein